jgi:hypothetical protein
MRACAALILVAGGLLGAPVAAQTPPEPPGPYVIDIRGAIGGLPGEGYFPPVPTGTFVPSRGFGFDVGAHVYWMRIGAARLGLGLNVMRVRGTASTLPTAPSSSGTTTPPATVVVLPDVESTFTTVAPQISFNFGTVDGWSYLSAGLGRGSFETRAIFPGAPTDVATSDATRRSASVTSMNFGGGARWFLVRHLAVGFDLRFHRLSSGDAGEESLGTPGAMPIAVTIGLSLR